MRHHSEAVRGHVDFLLARQLHLVTRQWRHKWLIVGELVGRLLHHLSGGREVKQVGHQLQRAVVVVVRERERLTVVQRPPSLVTRQPQGKTTFGLPNFCR